MLIDWRFVTERLRQRYYRWIDRHIGAKNTHFLNRKNLFIFPSAFGLIFLVVVLVIWLLGTNYQNNLILALAFFMIGLLVVTILHTFQNLNRLELEYVGETEVFAGGLAKVRLAVKSHRKRNVCHSVHLYWQHERDMTLTFDLASDAIHEILMPIQSTKRGMLRLPRLGISTSFPFGLIRCWSWLNLDVSILVYPKPLPGLLKQGEIEGDEDSLQTVAKKGQDFGSLREYDPSDGLRNVYWKALARGQGLLVKEFEQQLSQDVWIDFDAVLAADLETKLSIMCFWVQEYEQKNMIFGLRLPNTSIPPGAGATHIKKCLSALAIFGDQGSE